MLLQRVITAVVLLIIIIGALLISPLVFTAVAAIAIGCCFWEWLRICKWNNGVAMVCGVVLGASFFFLEYASPAALQTVQSGNGLMIITATATVLWAVITAVIFTRRTSGWRVPQGIGALLGWIFVPAAWFSLMYLFREKGTIYMLSVLAIVWVADIMAYFGGRCFGGPKMAQGISPKKTWSGALTAFVCVLALSYVLYWAQPSFPLWTNALISHLTGWTSALILILVVLFSIAGDLFESALKRTAGVKDSSNLLPGHGGFYDRLDAQMSVLPLTVFILLFLQGY